MLSISCCRNNASGCAGILLAWPGVVVPDSPTPEGRKKSLTGSNAASDILPLWIHPIKPFHTLLIHRKHNRSTHHQPRQPRPHPTPKRQQPLLPPNQPCAPQRAPIQLLGLQALHPRLDRIEWLRHQHRHQSRCGTDTKRRCGGQLLARRHVGLRCLAEEIVRAESHGAVGCLSCGRGHEAREETRDASLGVDNGDGVEEAAHAWDCAFAVVDSRCKGREGFMSVWVGERERERAGRLPGKISGREPYNCVLILSVGVTANKLSVTPAAKPASAARGPVTLPSASARRRLY